MKITKEQLEKMRFDLMNFQAKINIEIEKIQDKLSELEIPEEPQIQKGTPCLFWDEDNHNNKVFGIYGYTNGSMHFAIDRGWWDYCEPCWPAIFILCDIPKEYNWIACDHYKQWYAYNMKPLFINNDRWLVNKEDNYYAIRFYFIPHPLPENSLYSRDDIPEVLR